PLCFSCITNSRPLGALSQPEYPRSYAIIFANEAALLKGKARQNQRSPAAEARRWLSCSPCATCRSCNGILFDPVWALVYLSIFPSLTLGRWAAASCGHW